jgi:hypothetical protein
MMFLKATTAAALLLGAIAVQSQQEGLRRKRRATTVDDIQDLLERLDQDHHALTATVMEGGRLTQAMSMPAPTAPSPTASAPTAQSPTASAPTASSPTVPAPTVPTPSSSPTAAPNLSSAACANLSHTDAMIHTLARMTNATQLNSTTSPQGMAFNWLTNVDPKAVDPCVKPGVARQRYAVAVFFYATGGDFWTNRTNWMTGKDECFWYGLTCNAEDETVSTIVLRK